jgi:hypothetical protein
MLRKNQYLLLPHVPSRSDNTSSSNTMAINETSDMSDVSLQHTVNNNFLMENSEHSNLAVINENDENYFEIFKMPMRFGTENNTEVTTQIGTTAHLPCTIHNIGEGVVSYISILLLLLFSINFIQEKGKKFLSLRFRSLRLDFNIFNGNFFSFLFVLQNAFEITKSFLILFAVLRIIEFDFQIVTVDHLIF